MKRLLFICLLLAGCQPKNKSKDQQVSVTINGKKYTDSVAVDSAGNRVRVKPGAGRVGVIVSGSGNDVKID
ncbi:cupredoxin domain-containing protein [Spirosoma fluviale]|uniref:Uncharacterized protein n=1 Tax=Spirosoma fluviale TaxID=1597977 RepID=A0A286F5A4_9BACT|nr:hypothetical protein [Spirosoma fluviale]SOD78286.1 hypothetical protein SAMN06269250_0386 [Spirosoma fluviale]